MAEVKAAADSLNSDSDYGQNMNIVLAAETGFVSSKNVGTLGSLVSVYHRAPRGRGPQGCDTPGGRVHRQGR